MVAVSVLSIVLKYANFVERYKGEMVSCNSVCMQANIYVYSV